MTEKSRETGGQENLPRVDLVDELPLWSAPFGLKLLEAVEMKPGLRVLDIGCGAGFPLVELAMRLGENARLYGIDPWKEAAEHTRRKLRDLGLSNAEVEVGECEDLPFENAFFDLQVSNNGLNNVRDRRLALAECARTAKPGAQLVLTMNLDTTMRRFYTVFEEALIEAGLAEEIGRLQAHIHHKRPPLPLVINELEAAGYTVHRREEDEFSYRFIDGKSFFRHFTIREFFLPAWREVVDPAERDRIFTRCRELLDILARYQGELRLRVPFVLLDCRRRV